MRVEELERMYRLEDTYWWFRARRLLVRLLLQRAGIAPGSLVLDAGCGSGGTFKALRDTWQVIGADISPVAVAFCRSRGMELSVVGDITALPIRPGAVDAALSCDVFEHLDDDVAATRSLFEATRPGGVLVTTVPALPWLWSEHDIALQHRRRYTRKTLRAALEAGGWQVEWLNYTVSFLLPMIALFRIVRKLRRKSSGGTVDLFELPGAVNRVLTSLSCFEARLASRMPLPPGATLLAIARKRPA
jgi:SAM-dependent methyltransferase